MLQNLKLFDPDFLISCQHIDDPAEIYTIMRERKITRAYVYGMVFRPTLLQFDFIKIGMSAPNLGEQREYQVGERVVRQIAWVPGWQSEHVKSDHGYAFYHEIKNTAIPKKLLPSTFSKNQLHIAVWNVSSRATEFDVVAEDVDLYAAKWAEGSLVHQYKILNNGKKPMLNFADPSKTKEFMGSRIKKSQFNTLFEIS